MMRPLIAAAALGLAAPAAADCLADGSGPAKITFDSGAVVEVTGHQGDVLSYRQTVVDSGKTVEMTVHLGVFTLSALRDGEGAVFDWKTDLPKAADLVPGATFQEEAMLTTPGFLPPRPFKTDLTVVGDEDLTVAGCTIRATKMVIHNREAGKDLGEITKWVHMPTLLTLRSEVREGSAMRAQEAVTIE